MSKHKKHKSLTKTKAKKILHDKSVRGHKLTSKQRKLFGAVASGQRIRKSRGRKS